MQILETEVALKMFEHITNHIHKQSKQGCPDPSILEGLQQEFWYPMEFLAKFFVTCHLEQGISGDFSGRYQ